MKTKQEFITEFVLRAMARPDIHYYNYPARYAADLALEAWDAIPTAELPESEKAKQSVIAANSLELKQLAELAAAQGFEWIAQDKSRIWYGYKAKPEFRKHTQEWQNGGDGYFAALNIPDNTDYSKECYRISNILGTE